ncbi:MAG: YebC/PmpR family DNA-binding transcriptional regulator [Elusimicrobiota bacterium]
MSGHNKWASIKHKKAAVDAKRGKAFTKIIREISMAAKIGGGVLENNARLRNAVDDARSANMPQDNIKKAIQRGTGELPGVNYEELIYEGYGPGGVAVIVEVTTDNKNRSASDVRRIFSKNAGNMGEAGCVGWMFSQKGLIDIDKSSAKEEDVMNVSIEAGAEDIKSEDKSVFQVITSAGDLETVKKALDNASIKYNSAEITMIPQTYIKLEGKQAEQMLRLMDELDENDDVKNVYANFDISDDFMEKLEG